MVNALTNICNPLRGMGTKRQKYLTGVSEFRHRVDAVFEFDVDLALDEGVKVFPEGRGQMVDGIEEVARDLLLDVGDPLNRFEFIFNLIGKGRYSMEGDHAAGLAR